MKGWIFGTAARGVEAAFTAGWSLGEVAYTLRRPGELLRDPYREAVLGDIETGGLYREFPGEERELAVRSDGWIRTPNPYRYIGDHPADDIVAHMLRHRRSRKRHLLVMCHCYGLPVPRLMERIFSLDALGEFDVVYNIMNKHYAGSFAAWPGFGLMSPRLSQVIEVMRSSIVGLRSLIRSLRATWGYETVSVMGYSIGGQLALHVANSMPLDRLVVYCPVTHFHRTFESLGLMPHMVHGIEGVVKAVRSNYEPTDLHVLDPLIPSRTLQLAARDLLVIVQKHDMMVPPDHVEPIRTRYPEAEWHEFGGTHTFPDDRKALAAVLQRKLGELVR